MRRCGHVVLLLLLAALRGVAAAAAAGAPPVVVVVGASRGLGAEIALVYAGRNAIVHAVMRSVASAPQALANRSNVVLHGADTTRPKQVAALGAAFASKPIELLINVAGINRGPWEAQLAINHEAPFAVIDALLPALLRGAGRKLCIVTTAPASVKTKRTFLKARKCHLDEKPGGCSYAHSKHLTHLKFLNLAPGWAAQGVAAIAMDPGFMRTSMSSIGGVQKGKVEPAESAAGIAKVLDGVSLQSAGRLYNWQGVDRKLKP